MKFYISNSLANTSNIDEYLTGLGIETTTDIDDTDIDSFVLLRVPEPNLQIDSLEEITSYVETYNLNTADYLNNKFGISGSHQLNDKWNLHQALTLLDLPRLETIYPTTEQEIRDFFDSNEQVFVKPAFYYGSIDPWTDLNKNLSTSSSEVIEYLNSIPRPSTVNHFYKSYSTYDSFAADVDLAEFLTVQNAEESMPIHQCIMQLDITASNPVWNHFIVLGYVNGNNDVIHDAYIVMPRGNDETATELYNIESASANRNNNIRTKISFDFNSFSESDITNMLTNRHVQGSDPYNMEATLKSLFAQTNTRNTYFTAQGYINSDNDPVIFDMSTGKISPALRRTWITAEQQLARLQFMLDQSHDATKLTVDTYRFWFEVRIASGVTTDLLSAAADYNVKFMMPVREGFKRFPCTAYGDTPAEVAANVKQYLALCAAA